MAGLQTLEKTCVWVFGQKGGDCGFAPRRITSHRDGAEEPQSLRLAAMFQALAGAGLRAPASASSVVAPCMTVEVAYPSIPRSCAAVPPRILIRSSSLSPGIAMTWSTGAVFHGNG